MGQRWLRVRSVVDSHAGLLVAALLVLGLLGGWLTYTVHVDPGTRTVERTVSSWSMTGEYNHSATVTEPNPVAEVGTTQSDRPLYLLSTSPVANGTFTFRYSASDGGQLDVDVVARRIVRSVDTGENGVTEVWRQSEELRTRSESAASPGSTVSVPFSVDAPAVRNRTERLNAELGNPPGDPQFAIVTTVTVDGTVNGRAVQRTESFALPVTFENGAYRLNATAATQRFQTTETVTVPTQPGPLRSVGGPALLAVALLGLVGFAVRGRALTLTPAERERLRYGDERETLDEWIHEMTLPEPVYERRTVCAGSLASLVDFAIDTNNSVIQDGDYYVLHDGLLYTYEPPSDRESRERNSTLSVDAVATDGEPSAADGADDS